MGWDEFEWDPENIPGLKLGLHIAQIIFAFVCFALEISVFKDDKALIVGNNGWAFGVVCCGIPRAGETTTNNMPVLPIRPGMDLPLHDTSLPKNKKTSSTHRHGRGGRRLCRLLAISLRLAGGVQHGQRMRRCMWTEQGHRRSCLYRLVRCPPFHIPS